MKLDSKFMIYNARVLVAVMIAIFSPHASLY